MSDKLTIQTIEYKTKITLSLPTNPVFMDLRFICFAPSVEAAIQQAIEFCQNPDNLIPLDISCINHHRNTKSFNRFVVSIEQVLIT